MLRLHARTNTKWDENPFVGRVTSNGSLPAHARKRELLLVRDATTAVPEGFRGYISYSDFPRSEQSRLIVLPSDMHVTDGDILAIYPQTGDLRIIYRKHSRSNCLLMTERCNSKCLMCSQPPRDVNDEYLVDLYLAAIPLMSPDTVEIGLSGGEPTLLGSKLTRVIRECKNWLPHTSVHVLSNGRNFQSMEYCEEIANIKHRDLMFGIPLYSDLAHIHDFVVQADGAYDETIRGMINLKSNGVKVELRVVLHQYTVPRLVELARFICGNLPFVDHVALMGLELMGYTKMNLNALWIDPYEYKDTLTHAVHLLADRKLNVSIYNHQLCVLNPNVWQYAKKSISDWKNDYIDACKQCEVRFDCGGFFSSGLTKPSRFIRPIASLQPTLEEWEVGRIQSHEYA